MPPAVHRFQWRKLLHFLTFSMLPAEAAFSAAHSLAIYSWQSLERVSLRYRLVVFGRSSCGACSFAASVTTRVTLRLPFKHKACRGSEFGGRRTPGLAKGGEPSTELRSRLLRLRSGHVAGRPRFNCPQSRITLGRLAVSMISPVWTEKKRIKSCATYSQSS